MDYVNEGLEKQQFTGKESNDDKVAVDIEKQKQSECSICLVQFEVGTNVVVLKC